MSPYQSNLFVALMRHLVRSVAAIGKFLTRAGSATLRKLNSSEGLTAFVKTVLVFGYSLIRQLRNTARLLHPRGKMRILLAHPHALRGMLAGIIIIVVLSNLNTRSRAAEDLGRESLLYRVVTQEAHAIVIDAAPATATPAPLRAGEIIRREDSLTAEELISDYPHALALGSGAILRPNPSDTLRGNRPRDSVITYSVQPDDTLSGIAYRFTLAINTLLWANDLRASSLIRPGQTIIIPPTDGVLHTVKRGETISSLAIRYRTESDKIVAFNNLADPGALSPGTILMVPDGRPPSVPAVTRPSVAVPVTPIGPQGSRVAGSGLLWPTAGHYITQYFSWRHSGLDIDGNLSSPIYAAEDGVVEVSQGGWNGGYGYVIVIDHGRGVKTRYGHLSRLFVKPGDRVERGQTIGIMGSTGRSTGSHLHFEVLINGVRKNPLSYL